MQTNLFEAAYSHPHPVQIDTVKSIQTMNVDEFETNESQARKFFLSNLESSYLMLCRGRRNAQRNNFKK